LCIAKGGSLGISKPQVLPAALYLLLHSADALPAMQF
jgi:hypothetical protein